MLKLIKLALLFLVIFVSKVQAQAETHSETTEMSKARITGFADYAPWGYYDNENYVFTTVFDEFIREYSKQYMYEMVPEFGSDYIERVREVRRGTIEIIFGIYYETEIYSGLEYVFPAIISNPITVIMLPRRMSEVKSIEDLKKLKGARHAGEKWSDYVNKEAKQFDLVEANTSYQLYEKLFKGDVDYILASHYFALVEAIKLGLQNKIAISKNVIWDMPLFIGLSKMSPRRGFLRRSMQKASEQHDAQAKIKRYLDKMIKDYENKYQGTVPPAYSIY